MSDSKPSELFWVDMDLSKPYHQLPYGLKRAGVRGGKRSSLQACLDAKTQILHADPNAVVKIYRSKVEWEEIT